MVLADLFLLLLIALSASSAAAESIYGCGGFVEASPALIKWRKASDAKLDYSHITVELRTTDGLVKDRTQCAPNGYYFIPVYDKGSFVVKVKGPEGWSLDPDSVPAVVDQNGCNANADINFRFTGFTISGRVLGAVGGESCSLKSGGPSNVKVELLSSSDDPIASALTSATGHYSFTNVTPGKYKLRASHPNLEIVVKGSTEVDLGFGNAAVDNIFSVSGYDLQGSVVAQGNPILGVHVYLYSDDVSHVPCPQGVGNAPRQKSALCHAVSDADGKFMFSSLPCGIYELLPYYKGENTVFDVSPPSMAISMEHHHVTVSQKFQVTGFSIGGRVVDGSGAGVDGVKIKVDGQQRAMTDSQGYYKLDQVTSKHYSIIAEKDHYKFNTLENFLVLPNMAYIDDIKAVYYDICGVVQSITGNTKAKVALTHGPENVKPQMKLTNEKGKFCFEVPPGEYRLSALAPTSESSSGLLFSPPHIDVKVDRPLLDVQFSEAQVNIHGTVLCKEKCDPSVSVSLTSLMGKGRQEKKTLNQENNDFLFSEVFPGKYRLEVKHIVSSSSLSEVDSWCWEQSSFDIDVGTEDLQGIVFVQKGYLINIISSHDTNAYFQKPDSSPLNLFIKKGSQSICVETPGEHELHFVNSCISFGSSSLKFDTLNPAPIYLTARKYLLKGAIHVDLNMLHDPSGLSERIIVDIYNKDNVLVDSISTKHVTNEIDQTGLTVYEYTLWSDLGEEFVAVPRYSSGSQEKAILFYPRQRRVSVTTDGCQANIPTITGRIGLYLEGSVSPPISGVNIRILAAGKSSYALLNEGDLAMVTETGEDGSFVAGPLYDDTSYSIEASKAGYHLRRLGPNSFTCQRLSQIVVNIYGGEPGELFPSVLLSLSGEDGYRNNSVSGAGGTFSFSNLFPGSFYLRPLLKEYSFSPAAVAIDLESGESKVVDFRATRVAYSAMGTVSLLSGQPKEGVYVEARSELKGYYEEATTDNLGNFRLRGLLPDTTYVIKVVAKEDLGLAGIERASPESIAIKVGTDDIRGVDFIVFEQPQMTIISGHVDGTNLEVLQPHLSVEIKSASDSSRIESIFPLPLSYYFEIRDLPKGKYLLQLRSALPSNSHIFKSDIVEVNLEKQPQLHVGPLRYEVEEHHHKQEPTPAPLFPLIVGVSVIALFISMPRLKDFYEIVSHSVGPAQQTSSTAAIKKDVRKPVLRKRTY
ncbi:nodal modulator 3 [Iris pallida]|uniref:Nodal modulator 3 n=1 Tax=Iris pallida TaxID=29817 RepID=A0AAX6G6P6_IRIPA|nr:nodal modulator 3 [Iris pallida]